MMSNIELLETLIDEIETKETVEEVIEVLNSYLDDFREEQGRNEAIEDLFEEYQDI